MGSPYSHLDEVAKFTTAYDLLDKSTHAMAEYLDWMEQPTRKIEAIAGLAATTFSLIFSVKNLLLDGYLISASIILRSALDRIGTIAWLSSEDETRLNTFLENWNDPARRPSIKVKLRCLENYIGSRPELGYLEFSVTDHLIDDWLDLLHSHTHGDGTSIEANARRGPTMVHFTAGPDLRSPNFCICLANLGVLMVGQLVHETQRTIPFLRNAKELAN